MNRRLSGDNTSISSILIDESKGPDKKGCTTILAILCIFNVLLKASYAVIAPFLPAEAASKGVDQSVVGIIFCVYSIAFAIVSPLVGKYLGAFGRRNFVTLGSFLVFISSIGFVILHYLEGKWTFIIGFALLRIIQGVGTGFLQTANYAIVSVMYPDMIDFACGCLEASAGIGLCFGPVIGVVLFQLGGYITPFIVFALIFLIYCFIVKIVVPASVDYVIPTDDRDLSDYSYLNLLSNKRILFVNLALIVNIFQYTFIDPFLADRMLKDFGYGESFSGVMFFILGLGYAFACQFAYKTLQYLSNRRCFFVFFIINGLCTMMYGPSQILGIPMNIYVASAALLIGGLSSAHTIIPTMPEIIDAGEKELLYPRDVLTDLAAGLFNMNFAIGEVLGPLVGNYLYVSVGMPLTGDIIGLSVITFGVVYFIS
jgi:MFS family permease